MGHSIKETSVPFDIDRPLTPEEIEEVLAYNEADVMEAFEIFVETADEFNSHIDLINEFKIPMSKVSKTKAQLSAEILGAYQPEIPRKDEFDITFPDTMILGRYSHLSWKYQAFSVDKDYDSIKFEEIIAGVPHKFGVGGIHGARSNYIREGIFIMADVSSYYPALMIEYDWLSRNVSDKKRYRTIRDERLVMKANNDKRQYPRKIVLNSTFGASKDRYNGLYDPVQANNICIGGQLLLVDLIDKLEDHCELVQSNTDGILIRLYDEADRPKIMAICEEWSKRTRMELEYDDITRVIQRDVNSYAVVFKNGKIKTKGVLKQPSLLDNQLPIVPKAMLNYLVHGIPVEDTINNSTSLMDFQVICKIGMKSFDYMFKEYVGGKAHYYNYTVKKQRSKNKVKYDEYIDMTDTHYGKILGERCVRVFATKDHRHGRILMKHKDRKRLGLFPSTPEHSAIYNGDITKARIPEWLDKQWYIDEAKRKIEDFYKKD